MMSEQNRNGEVWVFAEQDNGKLHDVVLELCGRARELADRLGVKVAAVLPGYKAEHLAPILYQHGVDRVPAERGCAVRHAGIIGVHEMDPPACE